MTRVAMCGWETGNINQIGSVTSNGATIAVANSTPTARTGTYYLKVNGQNDTSGQPANGVSIPMGSLLEHYGRVGLYIPVANGPMARIPFEWLDSAAAVQLRLVLDDADNLLRIYRGAANTLLATSATTFSKAIWHLVEWHVRVDPTTGIFQMKVDGATVLDYTGNTQQTANANVATVRLASMNQSSSGWGNTHCFDDLAINSTAGTLNNSWPGDGAIRALLPNGVGSTIGGTPLTGVPGAPNWGNVDEVPPSTTDYNYGSTVGTGELYTLTDLSGVGNAYAVNIIAYALNSDAGGGSIGLTLNTGAANNEGAAQAITASAGFYNRLLETDPTDSTAWTQTKLNALQVGITVR